MSGGFSDQLERNTKEKLMGPPFVPPAPHVVLLGAGASKAALKDGDRWGRQIPLMNDLPDILGPIWNNLIDEAQPSVLGFERQFAWLRTTQRYEAQLTEVQDKIKDFFGNLELPDHPTIYDYLILGLRRKDIIATFNWDPFLLLAHIRNRGVADLPDIRFLHGCVTYTSCDEHDILGGIDEACPLCKRTLTSGRLFFPDEDKDYASDSLVQRAWDAVIAKLKKAFHLTIFGYSGPESDYKARQLLLSGWKDTQLRPATHVEIIDVAGENDLRQHWKEFIPFRHDMIISDFWSSTIAKFPRRTAEFKLSASLYGIPSEEFGPFRTQSLQELQAWHGQLGRVETKSTVTPAAESKYDK